MAATYAPSPKQLRFYNDLRTQAIELSLNLDLLPEVSPLDTFRSGVFSSLIDYALNTVNEALLKRLERVLAAEASGEPSDDPFAGLPTS